jgi:hypothetical protein
MMPSRIREILPGFISSRQISDQHSGILAPIAATGHFKNTETPGYAYRFPDPS